MSRIDITPFLAIPFKDRGRDFQGADCWGSARLLFRAYGIDIPDFSISCFATEAISKEIRRQWGLTWQKLSEPEEPSLVVLGIDPEYPDLANHLGVYIGDDRFVHTINKQNLHIERLNHPFWSGKILGFFRYVG